MGRRSSKVRPWLELFFWFTDQGKQRNSWTTISGPFLSRGIKLNFSKKQRRKSSVFVFLWSLGESNPYYQVENLTSVILLSLINNAILIVLTNKTSICSFLSIIMFYYIPPSLITFWTPFSHIFDSNMEKVMSPRGRLKRHPVLPPPKAR